MSNKFWYFLIFISLPVVVYFSSKIVSPQKIDQKINTVTVKINDLKETVAPLPTVILISGLPNKHLIKTTFVPQSPEKNWDQPWQDACEEAALLTVDFFYKNITPDNATIKNDILNMIKYETDQNFTHDVDLSQMALIAQNHLNYTAKIIEQPTLEDLKSYIAKDIPIIVPANGKILYAENKHFNSGGPYYHHLVILGYDDNTQKFTVHDVGTQFGAYFKYSYQLLLKSIHDFPSSKVKQDINQGTPRVLILLK